MCWTKSRLSKSTWCKHDRPCWSIGATRKWDWCPDEQRNRQITDWTGLPEKDFNPLTKRIRSGSEGENHAKKRRSEEVDEQEDMSFSDCCRQSALLCFKSLLRGRVMQGRSMSMSFDLNVLFALSLMLVIYFRIGVLTNDALLARCYPGLCSKPLIIFWIFMKLWIRGLPSAKQRWLLYLHCWRQYLRWCCADQ